VAGAGRGPAGFHGKLSGGGLGRSGLPGDIRDGLGFLWHYEGFQAIGATRASFFINFVPVSAVLMAFVILGEPLSFALLAGAALVTGGVFLSNRFAYQGQARRSAAT
jgi:drug/metabolite transporter (DMT)-like permease